MWKTVKLGDVCELATGGTPSRKKKEYFKNGNIKWLVSGDINQREIYDCEGRITNEGLANSNAKYLPENSVLIALNGQGKTRGTVALLKTKATCNQSLVSINPKADIALDTKFLFYVLDGMYGKIRTMTGDSGNDRRGLNMSLIRSIEILLPPLPEQERIVAKLDAAFAEIDEAVEVVQQQMLQTQSLQQQKIDRVFWVISGDKKTLNDVCNLITCGVAARPEYVEEGIPFLSAQNVKKGQVLYYNHKYITKEKHQELTKKNKPKRGDLLYTRVGSFGEAAVVESDIEFSIFVSLTLIKTKNELNPYYLKHYLNSQRLKKLASNSLSGSGVGNLNVGTVRKFPITLPSIKQQLEVVENLNDLADRTERLYQTYQRKSANLQSLKSAILSQELQPSEAA